jgi:hypothetical protein
MKTIIGLVAATVTAAMTIVLPTPPAGAQTGMNLMTQPSALTEEEKQKRAEQEKAYKEQLDRIPDQKANNDPWGKVRSADRPPLSTPKAKKNQQQTGSK